MKKKYTIVRRLGRLGSILAVFVIGMSAPCLVLAEGTKQVFCDAGLYPGTDLLLWAASTVQADAHTQMTNAPEGREVLRLGVDRPWGGGGIFFIVGGQVVDADCSEYAGGHLRFRLNSTNALSLQIEYVTTGGSISKGSWTAPSTGGQWKEIVVPFTTLSPVPNLARIRGLFLLTAVTGSGPMTWFVDDIRWTRPVQRLAIYPTAAQVRPGGSVQFIVEGMSDANETVLSYPTFVVSQGSGDVSPKSPAASMTAVFKAGATLGSSTVLASLADPSLPVLSVTARVDVVSQPVADTCWLLSDTHALCVTPDTDSFIAVFQGGSVSPLVLEDGTNSPCEGTKFLRATVNHFANDGYSGWTYQWGLAGSPDTDTRDMSQFYEANLRFCFEAPGDLAGKVRIGIRSGNVPAGSELSYVVLTNTALFDNAWHEVAVPVAALAGSSPFADLARIKNLFTISVLGVTAGAQTFGVDNLRWEPQQPLVFTEVGRRPTGDFYLKLAGPTGTQFVLSRSRDLRIWENVLTNVLGTAAFEFTETNSARSVSFFYRAARQ
jgi:hypothetical protein